jgi:hypothetical protein
MATGLGKMGCLMGFMIIGIMLDLILDIILYFGYNFGIIP